jgi:hypothetical protein
MVMFEIGYDGRLGSQSQKHMVVFICFNDEIFALPGSAVCTEGR